MKYKKQEFKKGDLVKAIGNGWGGTLRGSIIKVTDNTGTCLSGTVIKCIFPEMIGRSTKFGRQSRAELVETSINPNFIHYVEQERLI